MLLTNKLNFNKVIILNYFIALIPLTIIIGNLAININIIIICLMGFIIYRNSLFIFKYELYKYSIYFFFLYLILITIFNNYSYAEYYNLYLANIIKSLTYLRFLVLFLVVNKLMEENDLNLKLFYKSCALFSLILAFDIIFQIIFGYDLIGNSISAYRPSGFFGEEHIAGSYLQKFILFFIFFYFLKLKKNIVQNFYIYISFSIFFLIILSTGNRMPTIIFIFIFFLYFLMQKKFKQFFVIFSVIIISTILLIKFPFIERMDLQIKNFINSSKNLIYQSPKLFYNNNNNKPLEWGSNGYLVHFNSGVQIWKKNKLFGHGLKSMPLNCKFSINQTCNTHPHNYFIELMLDVGIVGIAIIYFLFLLGLKNYLKYFINQNNINFTNISYPIFAIILFEFFPIRSSGSFFTTGNSIVIFLMLAIFLNFKKIKSNYNK